MKRWIIITAACLLAAAGAYLSMTETGREIGRSGITLAGLFLSPGDSEMEPASLAPPGAAGFVRIKNLEEGWEEVTSSPLWRNLEAAGIRPLSPVVELIAAGRKEAGKGGEILISRTALMEIAGRDLALALFTPRTGAPAAILIVTRAGIRARAAEAFARIADLRRRSGERMFRETVSGGKRIFILEPRPAFPYRSAYTFIDGYLVGIVSRGPVLSLLEEALLRRAAAGKTASLIDSSGYRRGLRSVECSSPVSLCWYLRPRRLLPILAGEGLIPFFSAPPVKDIAGSLIPEGGIRSRFWFRTPEPVFPAGDLRPPARIDALIPAYPPAGSICYLSFRIVPARFWERLTALCGPGFLRDWEEKTSLTMERDIIPLLGGEGRLFLRPAAPNKVIPLPDWGLVLTVRESDAAEQIMGIISDWLLVEYGLISVREKVGERTVTVFPNPFLPGISYLIAEKMLICGGSRKMISELVDRLDRGDSFVAPEPDPSFRRNHRSPDPGILFYCSRPRAVPALIRMAEWYLPLRILFGGDPIITDRDYRGYLLPLLEALEPLTSIQAEINLKDTVVNGDVYCYIASSP